MKRTKIVCTIGPATNSLASLIALGKAGMDVARLNFSHGTHPEHAELFSRIQAAGKKLGQPFGVLQDLQGPKIRVGELPKEGVHLVAGRRVIFSTAAKLEEGDIPVTLPSLHQDVGLREHILLDDGLLEVEVRKIEGYRIFTEVVQGGLLTSHKGLNLPGTTLHIPALSKKDRDDAIFGAKLGVDFVGLSFVRSPQDVKDLRKLLLSCGPNGKRAHIIAKIEKREAVESFAEILPLVDGVMVARGDLGIEMPAEMVPVIQKQLIAACREKGVPVIVATQMLDSMIRNPRPTRAEVSDVANAVADHADAVMLSGETASGAFPIEAVRIMNQSIQTMENSPFDNVNEFELHPAKSIAQAIGMSVRLLTDSLENPVIVAETLTGHSVREMSSKRPETRIYAYTPDAHVARQLRLVWGVEPRVASRKMDSDAQFTQALKDLRAQKIIKKGTTVIGVSGTLTHPKQFSHRIEIVQL